MSGRSAQVIDEMDDVDDEDVSYGGQSTVVDLPVGLANIDRQPQGRRAADQDREPAFTVVETDEDGNEVGAQQHREAPLDAEAQPEAEYGQSSAAAANGEQPRPRLSRSERSKRQRERFARIDQDNQELRQRLDEMTQAMGQIEPRLSEIDQARRTSEVRELDRQVQAYQHQAALARQSLKDAFADHDPDAMEAALDARDMAVRNAEALTAQKRSLEAAPAPRQQQQAPRHEFQAPSRPAPLPPEVLNRVEDFADANPWYKPHDTNDIDSQLILRIDDQVAREGFDPRAEAYWSEIEKRAARYLPHRFGDASNQRPQPMARQPQAPQRRGPMVAGGAQGSSPAPQNNRVMITPARKQALVEIGVVAPDGSVVDRGRYNRMIAGYAAFDRDNVAAR